MNCLRIGTRLQKLEGANAPLYLFVHTYLSLLLDVVTWK